MALSSSHRYLLGVAVVVMVFLVSMQLISLALSGSGMESVLGRRPLHYYNRIIDLSRIASMPCSFSSCVFLDISIDSAPAGRMVLQLYQHQVPNVVMNFKSLAVGERGQTPNGTRLHYEGTSFNRILQGILIQGGDIFGGSNEDFEVVDVSSFENESNDDIFDKGGLVALVGTGSSRNGYEFFVTIDQARELDGQHLVFGEVIRGMDVVYKINDVQLNDSEPKVPIIITKCGIL